MSGDPPPLGPETMTEGPMLDRSEAEAHEEESDQPYFVPYDNPNRVSSDLYAAEYLAEYDSPFGLHDPHEWRDTNEHPAGELPDGTPVEGEWARTTPIASSIDRYGPASEADSHYRRRETRLEPARTVGEGSSAFADVDSNDWEDSVGDEDDRTPRQQRELEEANLWPLRFYEIGVRDIEIFWRWVGGMSSELTRARAVGWLRVERLLQSVRDQLYDRGRTLQETWQSQAEDVSASETFMTKVDSSIAALDAWEWVAGRHQGALYTVAQEIDTAQRQLGALYTHYRVALALVEWRLSLLFPDDPTVLDVQRLEDVPPPQYADGVDTSALPTIGTLEGQEEGEWGSGLLLNDPSSASFDPGSTPVLYDGSGAIVTVGNPRQVLEAYHERAAEIVQRLADTYVNEQRFSLTRMRQWGAAEGGGFGAPTADQVGMPRDLSDIDPQGFVDNLMAQMGNINPGGGAGPVEVPMPVEVPVPVPVPMAMDPFGNGPMPFDPNLMMDPNGGFLAGMPAFRTGPPGFMPPQFGISPGSISPIGPPPPPPPGPPPPIPPIAPIVPRFPAPGGEGTIPITGPDGARPGFTGPAGATPGQALPAGATPAGTTPSGVTPSGVTPSGVTPSGTPFGVKPVLGITPDSTAVTPPGTAQLHGTPALPGATAMPEGQQSGMAPPPMFPPGMRPMGGQQGQQGRQGAPSGQMPMGPPAFMPPGRVSQPGSTPTTPRQRPATLPGMSARDARGTGRLAGTAGRLGLRGTGMAGPAVGTETGTTAGRQQPGQPPAQSANPERVPAAQDREAWKVKKPKGVLKGSGPVQPASHGKSLGSPG